jgi:hypothetical protein
VRQSIRCLGDLAWGASAGGASLSRHPRLAPPPAHSLRRSAQPRWALAVLEGAGANGAEVRAGRGGEVERPTPAARNAKRGPSWPAFRGNQQPREGGVSGTYPVVAEANQREAMSDALLPQPGGFEGV